MQIIDFQLEAIMNYSPETLFAFARFGIESHWGEFTVKQPEITPELKEERATFVTLTVDGHLRGCVGSIAAYRPLWQDVENNGFNAAFRDFRFKPLSQSEYEHIAVEVSILTPPELVDFKSEEQLRNIIQPHEDGIIFSCHGKQATFLPQVWEQLPEFDEFFMHLSVKAGLGPVPDFENASIKRYQVERHHE